MIKSYKITKALALAATLAGSTAYADPTFILKNGSNAGAIQVDIMQNGSSLSGRLISIAKGDEYATNIPVSNLTTIELHYCKTSASCKTDLPEKMIAQFPKGKTIYIKFDGKHLEVQKGTFGTTTGKYSGLSLANNVKQHEIKITHAKTSKTDLGVGGSYRQEPTLTGVGKTGPVRPEGMMQAEATGYKPAKPTAPKPQQQEPGLTGVGKTGPVRPEGMMQAEATGYKPTKPTAPKPQKQEPGLTGVGKTGPIRPEGSLESPAVGGATQVETQQDPLDLAWKHFPTANKFRIEEGVEFFDTKGSNMGQLAHVARQVLNVPKNIPDKEIAKEFRKLSIKYHPDKTQNNDQKNEFTAVQNILSQAKDILIKYNETK
jgi:hypothetical protein